MGGSSWLKRRGRVQSPILMQEELQARDSGDFALDPDLDNPELQRQLGRGQFFPEEVPEVDPDVVPWGPEHPLWLPFMKGDVKLVRGIDGQEHLVAREAYAARDHIPTEDFGTSDTIEMDLVASFARVKYSYAKTLVAYAIADPLSASSPLLIAPTQASDQVPPIGGAIATAQLDFGHLGTPQSVIFDIPPGQIIKAPFAGRFGILSARLRPRYYTNSDSGAGPVTRQYLAFPGGPVLTNQLWNSTQTLTMAQNGFAAAGGSGLTHSVRGWLAEGFLSNDVPSKPARRFYGTVKCTNLVNTMTVFCPVAFAATYVQLVGGATLGASATNSTEILQFFQVPLPTSGVGQQLVGPFPPNQLVPLIAGCQNIVVVNSPNVVTANILEVPFELDYFLSF